MQTTKYRISKLPFPSWRSGDIQLVLYRDYKPRPERDWRGTTVIHYLNASIFMHGVWINTRPELETAVHRGLLRTLGELDAGTYYIRAVAGTSTTHYTVEWVETEVCNITIGASCIVSTVTTAGTEFPNSLRLMHVGTDEAEVARWDMDTKTWVVLGTCPISDFRGNFIGKIEERMLFEFTGTLYITVLVPLMLRRYFPPLSKWFRTTTAAMGYYTEVFRRTA